MPDDTQATAAPTADELADWRYQCEERIRRWAQHRATPEWRLDERDLLRLLNERDALDKRVKALLCTAHLTEGDCGNRCILCEIDALRAALEGLGLKVRRWMAKTPLTGIAGKLADMDRGIRTALGGEGER